MAKASASPALLAADRESAPALKPQQPQQPPNSLRLQAVFSLEKPRAKLLDLHTSTGRTVGPSVTAAAAASGGGGGSADGSTAKHAGAAMTAAEESTTEPGTPLAASGSSAVSVDGAAALSPADFQVRHRPPRLVAPVRPPPLHVSPVEPPLLLCGAQGC